MKKLIITAGQSFADIDVFACAIAYSELLTLEGKANEIVLPGVLNSSVTKTIKDWNLKYSTSYIESDADFVIVDVSESAHFAKFVKEENIVELYDHRFGFQDYWKEKLGDNSHIEFVGACTTLIWEEYKKRGLSEKISKTSANLLAIATLSNTLNFGSSVTTERDIIAFKELEKYIDLPKNWKENYFSEVEVEVFKDINQAIINDTKTLSIPSLNYPIEMGQLELWNASEFLNKYKEEIKNAFSNKAEWFISIPSISENKNYVYTESEKIKNLLKSIIKIDFNGEIGITDKLWLRKEIRKKLLEL